MRTVILAGGVGNRLAGDTEIGPKPMVEIGGHPILWHIMQHYAHHGFKDFVVASGYKGTQIKGYFANYHLAESDMRFDLSQGSSVSISQSRDVDWTVDVVDTGRWTGTGGRLLRLAAQLDDTFMVTFGDAVSDVDLRRLLDLHHSHDRLVTITAVHPPPRFGELVLEESRVAEFSEKPMESGWTNGGYMVMEPGVFDFIERDDEPLSPGPLERLAEANQLAAYRHLGFWLGMDTLRDRTRLERLWATDSPPWKVW